MVRNHLKGVTVTIEDGSQKHFDYIPMAIKAGTTRETLDSYYDVTLGDLGEYIPAEIDRIEAADMSDVKPKVVYREYRSDNLGEILYGPIRLEVSSMTPNADGTTSFRAEAPKLNLTGTGRIYSITDFPSLRGFL